MRPPTQPVASGQPSVDLGASVAVLPFTNISGDPTDEWIGEGIAETVTTDFLQASLLVVDRQMVADALRRVARPNQDAVGDVAVLEAGRDLGVRWTVSGAYQRVSDRVRITVSLDDVQMGRTVRVLKIDGAIDDLFSLQDRLAPELMAALAPESGTGDRGESAQSTFEVGDRDARAGNVAEGSVASSTPALAASEPSSSASDADVGVPGLAATGPPVARTDLIDGPPPPVPPEVVSRDAQGRATIRAVRVTGGLQLDGRLDEPVYGVVLPIDGFIQQLPNEGAPASEQTEAWLLYDETHIYVSARCYDSAPPSEWVASEMRRDTNYLRQNDTFGLLLDTFYDRRNGVGFYTNPIGALGDTHVTDESTPNTDWNPVWDVRTGRFEGGWTVEMAIPFKSLRYRQGATQVWGVQFRRSVRRKNEWSYITRLPISAAGAGAAGWFRLSLAATLVGLEVPDGSKNVEIKPYAIAGLTTDRAASPAVLNAVDGDVGFDVKYGVTQNLTADLTYNTDFAQVEVDEQQINLTRFSLFFPEKREFFLEGRGIFDFGRSGITGGGGRRGGGIFGAGTAPILFFSRRIGLQAGREVPIVAGGRLTGKAGKYGIGAVNIQTGDEALAGAASTNFTAVRIKRDILRRSNVGAIFTGRSRSLAGRGSNEAYRGRYGVFVL